MTPPRRVVMFLDMAKRAIYDDELHAHFVTFSCYRRRRLLDHDRAKRIVLGVLNSQLTGAARRVLGLSLCQITSMRSSGFRCRAS